jgi:hypothetical protein
MNELNTAFTCLDRERSEESHAEGTGGGTQVHNPNRGCDPSPVDNIGAKWLKHGVTDTPNVVGFERVEEREVTLDERLAAPITREEDGGAKS